jgi:S1-C subfamily serine protease
VIARAGIVALLVLATGPAAASAAPPTSQLVAEAEPSVVVIDAGGSTGSGFAMDAPGVIYTNAHVVGDADRVRVIDRRGRSSEARVAAIAERQDVARLVTETEIPPLERASDAPQTGDDVLAIGAPSGLGGTVTRGIVSTARRVIAGTELIQTDLAVNPGNSGGPLLNDEGDVVGIVTAKADGQEGIAFALPIDAAAAALGPSDAPLSGGGQFWTWLLVAILALTATVAAVGFARGSRRAAGHAPIVPLSAGPSRDEEPLIIVRRRRTAAPVTQDRKEEPWT